MAKDEEHRTELVAKDEEHMTELVAEDKELQQLRAQLARLEGVPPQRET